NFYKNMLICVGLLYPLITLNFSLFYCVSLFAIAYSCYFFVVSPKKMGFALWLTPSYQHFIILFLVNIMLVVLCVVLFCCSFLYLCFRVLVLYFLLLLHGI